MPVPKPNEGESEKDFIGRCAAIMAEKDPDKDNDQRVAICYEAWRSKGVEESEFFLPLPSDLGLTPQGSLTEKCKGWSPEAREAAAAARRGKRGASKPVQPSKGRPNGPEKGDLVAIDYDDEFSEAHAEEDVEVVGRSGREVTVRAEDGEEATYDADDLTNLLDKEGKPAKAKKRKE